MKHYPKRILFDGILLQTFAGGGAAYVYKVLCGLHNRILVNRIPIEVFLLYDSRCNFVNDYPVNQMINKDHLVDISHFSSVSHVVEEYKIDKLFIGAAQFWIKYNLTGIKCCSVVVIHDLFDCEIEKSHLDSFVSDDNLFTRKRYLKLAGINLLKVLGKEVQRKKFDYNHLMKLCVNDSVELVTVSEYSSSALRFFFPQLESKSIHVLYSPHKIVNSVGYIHNKIVNELVLSKKKYYLMVSTNRWTKNARFAIDTFMRLKRKDLYLVTVGYPCSMGERHIICPFLSENDLDYLYRHAYALIYPSLEEGFGYPPIEAMRYGVPVVASNVCSMPEICGDGALYFSPFHHNSLYMQLLKLEETYEQRVEKSQARYAYIKQRQEEDFERLLDLIVERKSN